MKKILLILAACHLLAMPAFAKTSGQPLDQMVAIVNEDLITRSELDHAMTAARLQISQQPAATSVSDKSLEKQVLDQLINKKLQLQAAEAAGIQVSDDDVKEAIQKIASQNNVSVDELMVHVEGEGMSAANYKHEIHDQMVMQKLQQREVAGKISVTPEEVTAFMKANSTQKSTANNEYRLQDILVPLSDTPSAAEIAAAKERANTLMQKLKSGTSFTALAQAESKGANALQGGDMGWRKLPEIPTAFMEHVPGMKKNGLAGPIQTGNGFHILLLTDVRQLDSGNQMMADRKSVEMMLMQQKFEQAVQSWVSKLRSTAFISATV